LVLERHPRPFGERREADAHRLRIDNSCSRLSFRNVSFGARKRSGASRDLGSNRVSQFKFKGSYSFKDYFFVIDPLRERGVLIKIMSFFMEK
jgi:hypothetical protein